MLSGLRSAISFGQKILLVVVVFFIIISVFISFISGDKKFAFSQGSVNAQVQKNRAQIYQVINNPNISKSKDSQLALSAYKMLLCGGIGEACSNNPRDKTNNFQHSVFGYMSQLMVLPYSHPPASGIAWVKSSLSDAGFTPKAYAAEGIGMGAIKPFSNLWKVFRDVAYLLLVLILVAIGFMIMFRMKLNPQTVISVESALPRIVFALLLITFSFAIAGFLIDLMYVVIAIAISVLSNNGAYYDAAKFQNEYLNADFWKLGGAMFPTKNNLPVIGGLTFLMDIGNSILLFLGPWINGPIRFFSGIFTGWYVWSHAGFWLSPLYNALNNISIAVLGNGFSLGDLPGVIIWFVLSGIGTVLGATFGSFILPQLIIGLLVLFTILLLLFRIFFMLLKSYIQILLMIIFAPIFLLFEAVPGRNAFGYWFKNLFAELMTFVIVVVLFLVGYIIVNTITASSGGLWTPPFLYGLDSQAFSLLLGMAIILMIPELVKTVKELMGIKGLPVSFGIGTFFGGATTAAGGGLGLLSQYGSLSLAMPGLKKFAANLTQNTPLKSLFENP